MYMYIHIIVYTFSVTHCIDLQQSLIQVQVLHLSHQIGIFLGEWEGKE